MTLHRAILEIDAQFKGKTVTGEFNMVGNLTVSEQTRLDYVAGNTFGKLNAITQRLTGNPSRRGIFIDLGAGAHTFEVEFNGWEGAVDSDGNDVTWGDPSESSPSIWNATGADPFTQLQVFHRYLSETTIDSINPARLYTGEYHSTGLNNFEDVLYVAPQNPRGTHASEDYSTFDGMFQFIEVERLDTVLDAKERLGI